MPTKPSIESLATPLGQKARRFAEEYIVDLNATQAAERAGYSKKTAYSQGQRLLKDARVQAIVSSLKATRREVTGDLAQRVIRELELIAFADIGDAITVDDDGKVFVRRLDTLTPEARRALAEVTQVTTERTASRYNGDEDQSFTEKVRLSIKHHSKLGALKMLVDHLGLEAPKTVKQEVEVTDVTDVKARVAAKLAALASRKAP